MPELGNRLAVRFRALALQSEAVRMTGVEGRITHVVVSYNIFKVRPLTGLGLGNHTFEFRDYYTQLFEKMTAETSHGVHNGFLLILSELGLIGLAIMLWVFWRPIKLMRIYRTYRSHFKYPGILLGAASIFPAIMIKFGTAHSGLGRVFPVIFLLVLTNAYERMVNVNRSILSNNLENPVRRSAGDNTGDVSPVCD